MKQAQRAEHLRRQLRQLILLRETGPKSAAWHAARARMIWRLHDEIEREEQAGLGEPETPEPSQDKRIEDGG